MMTYEERYAQASAILDNMTDEAFDRLNEDFSTGYGFGSIGEERDTVRRAQARVRYFCKANSIELESLKVWMFD